MTTNKATNSPIVAYDDIPEAERRFIERMNDLCAEFPLMSCTRIAKGISRHRLKMLTQRMNEPTWDTDLIIEAIKNLPFYNGSSPQATWGTASLDWLLVHKRDQPIANFERLLQKYRWVLVQKSKTPQSEVEDLPHLCRKSTVAEDGSILSFVYVEGNDDFYVNEDGVRIR